MKLLPVIDLQQGLVVRGVAGRREEYRPIVSKLTESAEPVEIARAFRKYFGFGDLYLADLDAIAGQPPAQGVYANLLKEGFSLWVDAGLGSDLDHAEILAKIGVQSIIAGLESLAGPQAWQRLVDRMGRRRVVFSLDLKEGRPLGNPAAWDTADAWTIARQAIQLGAKRILVLDLAGVGVGQGPRTKDLCLRLRHDFPELELATGGGIRNLADLTCLQQVGVDHALVASALHDGRLTAADLRTFS